MSSPSRTPPSSPPLNRVPHATPAPKPTSKRERESLATASGCFQSASVQEPENPRPVQRVRLNPAKAKELVERMTPYMKPEYMENQPSEESIIEAFKNMDPNAVEHPMQVLEETKINSPTKMLDLLLEVGGANTRIGPLQRTILIQAAQNRNDDIIDYVITKFHEDVAPNLQDNQGNTALILACLVGYAESINALITSCQEKGKELNFNLSNHEGLSPLTANFDNMWTEIFSVLLENGADPNIQDQNGNTPLMLLFQEEIDGPKSQTDHYFEGRLVDSVLCFLNHKGTDINLRNNEGRSALDYLKENQFFAHHSEVQEYLNNLSQSNFNTFIRNISKAYTPHPTTTTLTPLENFVGQPLFDKNVLKLVKAFVAGKPEPASTTPGSATQDMDMD